MDDDDAARDFRGTPTDGPEADVSTSLVVRTRMTVAPAGARVRALKIFCPAQNRTLPLDTCQRCPRLEGLSHDEHGEPCIVCCPAQPSSRPGSAEAPVGEVMGARVVCVRHDTELDGLGATESKPLPVVDGAGHYIGMTGGLHAPRAKWLAPVRAGEIAVRAAPVLENVAFVRAVGIMVRQHARVIAVVDQQGAVTGTLTDLDALRWVARRR